MELEGFFIEFFLIKEQKDNFYILSLISIAARA